MTCSICRHGELVAGTATVPLSRGNSTIIIKEVPADVCDNCGEYYLTPAISQRTYALADDAARSGSEVEIRRFAA